jgi:LssY C-terminus
MLFRFIIRSSVLLSFLLAMGVSACELPAGTPLWVRLATPVSSYFSRPGNEVHAVLTEDLTCQNDIALPAGTPIDGRVVAVKKVGWGVRHEIASLKLGFDRVYLANGTTVEIESHVAEVENAREAVKNGVIIGIRSTDTPQGTINSRLKHLPTWNPYTDSFLLAYKMTFPIFPEPEIWYGSGTDLRLRLVHSVDLETTAPAPALPETADDRDLDTLIVHTPDRVVTLNEKDADVVNLAFWGSREQLQNAFVAAGWVGSDKFSKASFFHEFHAFLDHSGYATAPMRPMLLGNALPDMLWQKSLNTYSKRDHVRIWESATAVDGTPVWIGAATHDDRATLSLRNKRFVHYIDPQIDDERAKIVRDLKAAGCVQSVSLVNRPDLPNHLLNATGELLKTDSRVALIELKDCSEPEVAASSTMKFKPGNVAFRYVRRQILTVRSDIWRANIVYGAYDLVRLVGHAIHSQENPPVSSDVPVMQAKADHASGEAPAAANSKAKSAPSSSSVLLSAVQKNAEQSAGK